MPSGVIAIANFHLSTFRGIALDRIPHVLKNGIDVDPTDSVIWTADLTKALEYGNPFLDNREIAVLVLDRKKISRSCVVFAADTPQSQVDEARKLYPNQVPMTNGTTWLTRLPADSPRAGWDSEAAYGRWIPGNAREALQAILIFGKSLEAGELVFREAEIRLREGWLTKESYTDDVRKRVRESLSNALSINKSDKD